LAIIPLLHSEPVKGGQTHGSAPTFKADSIVLQVKT